MTDVQLSLGLDEIAAEIHRVWANTRTHQIGAWEGYFRVGALLLDARTSLKSNQAYGEWFADQKFGFSLQWGGRLRRLAARKAESESALSDGEDPGVDALLARLRAKDGADRDKHARQITPGGVDSNAGAWRVLVGDFRERMTEFPDASVDLILTDPPYPTEFAPLWSELAVHAERVLKPGGIVAAMSGKIHLDDRMRRLGERLSYGWIYAQPLPGSNTRIMARRVLQEWKPWICYSKGPWPSGRITWHGDLLVAGPRAKDKYGWQQQLEPAVQLVERLCRPGDLVVDPFCGSGTSGVAAIQAGRRFVGIEQDANRVAIATSRLEKFAPS